MKKLVLLCLAYISRKIVSAHKPIVIGITGSVGKTTVRHFLYEYLKKQEVTVYSPDGNYNGEFGLPLSIMQARSGGKNLLGWLKAFRQGLQQLSRQDYPEILVLEYGIDRAGEMDFMCDIVEPDIAIFTKITENHIENFASVDQYVAEKHQLARKKIKTNAVIIKNADDAYQHSIRSDYSYGTTAHTHLYISDISETLDGIRIEFEFGGAKHKIQTKIFGVHNMATIAPCILALVHGGYEIDSIVSYFEDATLPAGRGNLLVGLQGSRIIDGSYNGSFLSIQAGLETLRELKKTHEAKAIALLGDMRELGHLEKQYHEDLTKLDSITDCDHVVFVGPLSKKYIQPLLTEAKFFLDAREAGKYIAPLLSQDTLVFVKGSQNTIFLEEAIKSISDEDKHERLVRQSDRWLSIKQSYWKSLTNKS